MSDTTHTPGPLHIGAGPNTTIIYATDGWPVCNATVYHHRHGGPEVADANARRLVACWNAFQGIATEVLEDNLSPFSSLRAERDKLQSELLDLSCMITRLVRRMRAARAGSGLAAGDDALERQAIGYLQRKGLLSPLRADAAEDTPDPRRST